MTVELTIEYCVPADGAKEEDQMLAGRRVVVIFALCALLTAGIAQPATVTEVVVSNVKNESSCNAGPAISVFSPTDTEVVVYLKIHDLLAGDQLRAEWVRPNGTIASNAPWAPLAEAGNWCFLTRMGIADTSLATTPGIWHVRIFNNDILLTTATFTISAGGATGGNLITNGSGEAGAANCDHAAASIPGWNTDGRVAVCSYSAGGGYPTASSPGSPTRGANFFTGGPSNANSSITQQVDVSAMVSQIDSGSYPYSLSAYIGGYQTQGDNAKVTITFRSGFSAQLGTATIGPVTAGARSSTTGMILKSATGSVPTGTRTILVKVEFARTEGSYNDGYVDDIHLALGTGGSGGGGGTGGCDYLIQPDRQTVPASGTSAGLVLVTTGTGCPVTATSNVSWITIDTTGASAVSFSVAPNTSPSPRIGIITISGRTFTVTQEGAEACTYTISPTSTNVAASGGSGSISVGASASACAWTAASNNGWISISSGSSGTGSSSVNYSVSANTDTVTRTGSLTVAGKTFTVSQAAGGAAGGGPQLSGAVNAASYTPSDLPGGGLAQGSFFSLFGADIGPEQWQQASSFPLPTTGGLGGVVVQIRQGGTVVTCALHFASKSQINGIIPSNAPIGNAEMVLIYQGREARVAVKIVKHNFGVFTLQAGRGPGIVQNWNSAVDVPLNTSGNPARPGQIAVIWGTGLGPITGPDNMAPPAGNLPFKVKVAVAGREVKLLYWGRAPGAAGVDNIYIELPADMQQGCNVPVQIEVENTYSNSVTMAVGQPGMDCTAASDIPFLGMANKGGKTGVILLVRASVDAEIEADNERAVDTLDLEAEIGLGLFIDVPPFDTNGNDLLGLLPLMGTCQSTATQQFDLTSLLGSLGEFDIFGGVSGDDLPDGIEEPEYQGLDAGTGFSISGPAGNRLFEVDDESPGVYMNLIGGRVRTVPDSLSLIAAFLPPPFLDGGSYQLTIPGGSQVGSVNKQFSLGAPVTLVSPPDTINRASGVTVNWSGSNSNQAVVVFGLAANQNTDTMGGFLCYESGSKSSFHVPASQTSKLPTASRVAGFDDNGAAFGIAVLPIENIIEFQATGLDRGLIIDGSIDLRTIAVQ
jgi:uncharacterized protein (TIGR03437 family)